MVSRCRAAETLGVFQSRIARDVHAAWMPLAVIGGSP
jgi:hypothetical protein